MEWNSGLENGMERLMHTVTANSHNKYTSTIRGKDSGTLLCYYVDQSLSTDTNSFH